MRKVLITGANGFIGKALCKKLDQIGVSYLPVTSKDGNLSLSATTKKWRDTDTDLFMVIHLAARTFVPDSWNSPDVFINENVSATVNMLEFCRTKKLPLIFMSAFVYDAKGKLPFTEKSARDGFNPYAMSKIMSEDACDFYYRQFEIPVTILRPFNIYGHGQNDSFLIPWIIKQAIEGDTITVNTTKPRRDYVYIDDLVNACIAAMKQMQGMQVYNIGSGYSISVADIINVVAQVASKKLNIIDKQIRRQNEIDDVYSDTSAARNELNWQPLVSFEEGIKSIYHQSMLEQ